jgi:hypothetical protein|tara:strand:- start:4353 stop:5015 length:663 start_codon:yes stop_codon:yes gene_type:complete
MKKFSAICIAVFLFTTSCKESTRVNLVSGTVYQDCNEPLPNTEIALKSNVGESFNAPIILGSGVTAADGTLSFTYELDEEDIGTGSLLLVKSTGFETLIDNVTLNKDFNLELFRNDISQLIVELSGTRVYGSNDTLFYGITSDAVTYQKIQPSNGAIDTIQIPSSSPNTNDVSETIYYGVGTDSFIRAKASASISDSTFNKLSILLNGCGSVTTANLLID